MYWNQIREEWPNEELRLFGPGTASGTYDYFFSQSVERKLEQEETIQHQKMIMYWFKE